jgi:dihydrofolate reductase
MIGVRKLVAAEHVTLDGVMEAPERWRFAYDNEELGGVVMKSFAASDALLMGRVLYEEWAAYWPEQDPEQNPIASLINGFAKYVVSDSLEEPLAWQNSTLIRGDEFAEDISDLKRQPGKDIVVSGSGALVRSLLERGLLDALQLFVHPVVLGAGKRLFAEGEERTALELTDSRTFATGVVHLTYKPAEG